jgi:mRNA-degrading endonuclease YafQ of YafQ-DinJ toxin-antitoxin module
MGDGCARVKMGRIAAWGKVGISADAPVRPAGRPHQSPAALLDISKKICSSFDVWRIEEHRRVDKQVATMPTEILKRYEKWKDIASLSGPLGLRMIKGFHDEALSGGWRGYRSSRLGQQWRVIYRLIAGDMLFQVESITAHDYRRS